VAKARLGSAASVLKALSHPGRLAIVAGLMKNECNVGQIQRKLSLPQATVSRHPRTLRDARVIRGRREGNRRCYTVTSALARKVVSSIVNKRG